MYISPRIFGLDTTQSRASSTYWIQSYTVSTASLNGIKRKRSLYFAKNATLIFRSSFITYPCRRLTVLYRRTCWWRHYTINEIKTLRLRGILLSEGFH